MLRLPDLGPARWIFDGMRRTTGPCNAPPTVCTADVLIPRGFETYLKILNPVWEHPEHGIGGVWVGPDDEWDHRFGDPPRGARRVRWAEVARFVGLRLSTSFSLDSGVGDVPTDRWPPSWSRPSEDSLDEPCFGVLLATLAQAVAGQSLLAYYDFGAAMHIQTPGDRPSEVLLRGDSAGLASFVAATPDKLTPTFLWPESRQWLVATPYDLAFSLLGGSRVLLEHVAALPEIEALWCEPKTAI